MEETVIWEQHTVTLHRVGVDVKTASLSPATLCSAVFVSVDLLSGSHHVRRAEELSQSFSSSCLSSTFRAVEPN